MKGGATEALGGLVNNIYKDKGSGKENARPFFKVHAVDCKIVGTRYKTQKAARSSSSPTDTVTPDTLKSNFDLVEYGAARFPRRDDDDEDDDDDDAEDIPEMR